LATATGGLGYWLTGRSRRPEEPFVASLTRNFTVPRDPSLPEMVVGQGDDPRLLLRRMIESIGGIKRFISRGDIVVVKPNIAWDRTPE